jgi:acetylornithine deacetylase/succinyl-diaminopimelate desuccinylase-like protein
VGSDHLEKFITDHKSMLQSDIILISDTGINSIQNPAITTGLRGLSYMEVTVIGPNRDLHSGLYGGTVANPINVLCDMIASLHDQNRKVNISGFYDQVVEISEQELQKMNENGIDEKSFKDSIGIDAVMGEKGYTTLDRDPPLMSMEFGGDILEKELKPSFPVWPMQKSPCVWFPIKIGKTSVYFLKNILKQ